MGELIAGGIVTALGALTFFYTLSNPKLTFKPVMSDGAPGAGFFPIILSVLLFLLGSALIIINFKKIIINRNSEQKDNNERKINISNLWTSLLILLSIVLFLVIWKLTGMFYVWMFILLIAISKIYKKTWLQAVLLASIVTGFLYLMFSVGFSIQFRV